VPVLEISDGKGQLMPVAWAWSVLTATMAYPDHEAKRDELAAVLTAEVLTKYGGADDLMRFGPLLVPILWKAPGSKEAYRLAMRRMRSARYASEMLTMWLQMAIHHAECEPNLSKVMHVLLASVAREDGTSWVVSSVTKRALWESWSRFRCVAHLHFPGQMMPSAEEPAKAGQTRKEEGAVVTTEPLSTDLLLDHLAQAELLRRTAEERRMLKPAEMWRSPPDLALPSIQLAVEPLLPWQVECLESYVPEFSRDADDPSL
jgi:hypothetical protein